MAESCLRKSVLQWDWASVLGRMRRPFPVLRKETDFGREGVSVKYAGRAEVHIAFARSKEGISKGVLDKK